VKIKKYRAKDFKTAILKAKEEMGRDAIILHTRQIKKGGILGFFYPPRVEITVAVDDNLYVNSDRVRLSNPPLPSNDFTTPMKKNSNKAAETKSDEISLRESDILNELKKMKNLMLDIKSRMFEVEVIKGLPQQVQDFYETLVNNHVEPGIALNIIKNVITRLPQEIPNDEALTWDVCLHSLQESVNQIQPIQLNSGRKGMIVFMVGPTGVGKTTTIAKLAANLTFLEGKDVALITLDTYRVSAAEQLRTFADIISIPISVVFTTTELIDAIKKYQEKDIIFVDTAGRSPYNTEQMQELQEFVTIANPDETILVLSATTAGHDLINIYQKFQTIAIDKLIFTKLDETKKYGAILNALYEIKKPLAYFTTGQNVPDDIVIPDSFHLAQMLVRRDEAI